MSALAVGSHARFSCSAAFALVGGLVACAIGGWLLYRGNAPSAYLQVNLAATLACFVLTLPLLLIPRRQQWPALLAATALLATALFGVEQDGIRRWVSIAGSPTLQPAFLLLPLLAVSYARSPDDRWHQAAMLVAALAMALQPDRSMVAALVAVSTGAVLMHRTREAATILAASLAAFTITLWRADSLDPVPFVEGVIAHAWQGGPLNRALLALVAAALLLPLSGWRQLSAEERRASVTLILCWATLLLSSIIAAYPTPLLGYGPSAIIGYFLSITALRQPSRLAESS